MTGADAVLSATRALCGACGALVDAQVVRRGEEIHLVKWCPDHGRTEARTSGDADFYQRSLAYVKPGTRPLALAVEEYRGCPESCGLCAEHRQHTCVPILEITDACDLACPICLVDGRGVPDLSVAEVARILDRLVANEGRINMITLSGGEPTSHPRLPEILDLCRRPEIGLVSLSTNGIRLAEDDRLLGEVVDRGVVVSLQFDGVGREVSERLRGRADLGEAHLRLVDRIGARGGRVSLTVTLARGVNEGEIPGALELLFTRDHVPSLMVQPLCRTGRGEAAGLEPVTIPEAIRLLAAGSGGVLEPSDFTPLPCSHPSCFALTYLLRTGAGSLVPLPRILDEGGYLEIIRNQALLGTDAEALSRVRDALYRLWSSDGLIPDREAVLARVRRILLDLGRLGPAPSHRETIELGLSNVKSVFLHHFMDRDTFDLSRAVKCCNHYPQADGRLLPACVRNNGLVPSGQ